MASSVVSLHRWSVRKGMEGTLRNLKKVKGGGQFMGVRIRVPVHKLPCSASDGISELHANLRKFWPIQKKKENN